MKTKRNSMLLVLTAFVWGIAFVAQSEGGDALGAFSFNGVRCFLAFFALQIVIRFADKASGGANKPVTPVQKKNLLIASISCGVVFFIASSLQQVGINIGDSAGKAGFLTTCYIILVPILGLFLKKKCAWNIWVSVVITLAGLYLLCINGSFRLQAPDILLLLCALMFAVHILIIDHFSPLVDGIRLSANQFLVCGFISLIPIFFGDMQHSAAGFVQWIALFHDRGAWIALLYASLISSGVGYTLQIIGQRDVNPTVASLLMSLESVFAVLAGWVLLHERLSQKELVGCVLIFIAVILAQIPVKNRKEKTQLY